MIYLGRLILFLSLTLSMKPVGAEAIDEDLVKSLKIEANHNLTRLKSLKAERSNQKIYENEREKGLGSFLEDQEKWDLARERGLSEYKKNKKVTTSKEDGPEYQAYLKEQKKELQAVEQSRRVQVRSRDLILNENKGLIEKLEREELGLTSNRPRYDLRKRGMNRWVKNSTLGGSKASSSGSGNSYSPPPPSAFDEFPPPPIQDYQPAMPMDGFEEIPPPPPPVYEGYGNAPFDSGFGDVPIPPPPPPPDFDF